MRCAIICNKTHQYPYNFIYKPVIVESITYPKINVLTLVLLQKSNVSGHYKTITLNIPKFISKTRSVPMYRCLMLNYRPLINGKAIKEIEINL